MSSVICWNFTSAACCGRSKIVLRANIFCTIKTFIQLLFYTPDQIFEPLIFAKSVDLIFSSPEPKTQWWANRIGRPLSSICTYVCMYVCVCVYVCVCLSLSVCVCEHFQSSSPQKPLGQLMSNFICSFHGMGERKFVQLVQVTWPRWPPCPYMVNLEKSFTTEPRGRWPWNLVCSIRCLSTIKYVQIMTLGWPWPILWQDQTWSLMLLYGKKSKILEFSETIVVYDGKVGRFS